MTHLYECDVILSKRERINVVVDSTPKGGRITITHHKRGKRNQVVVINDNALQDMYSTLEDAFNTLRDPEIGLMPLSKIPKWLPTQPCDTPKVKR